MYQNGWVALPSITSNVNFATKIFGNDVEKIIDTFVERKSSSKYSLKTPVRVYGMQKLLK